MLAEMLIFTSTQYNELDIGIVKNQSLLAGRSIDECGTYMLFNVDCCMHSHHKPRPSQNPDIYI